MLPTHTIKHVQGDGFCILHAFQESLLLTLGRKETFESLVSTLREELKRDVYQISSENTVNVRDKFEQYLNNPNSIYDSDTAGLFLNALGTAFKVNVLTFRSNDSKCVIYDLANPDNSFKDTLHFVQTEAIHLDTVVPINSLSESMRKKRTIM